MRKDRFLITLVFLTLLGSGCSAAKTWTYSSGALLDQPPLLAKSVAVPPFNDQRVPENKNSTFMYLIPLMPYGWQDLNQPEGINMHLISGLWQFKPTEDIAKAFASELNARRLFREAFYTFRESEGELVLRGTLTSTKYDGKLISYCLSAYGPLLWLFGLPAGTVKNDLAFSLRLEEQASKKPIWEKTYSVEHDHGAFWIYAMPEDFFYDKMLKGLMPGILTDLEQAIKNVNRP